jgi:hypothetical protein
VGPCLSPPAPDARVGPCLDVIEVDAAVPPPPADAGAPVRDASAALKHERDAVLDRLLAEGRLPADVAARLTRNRT